MEGITIENNRKLRYLRCVENRAQISRSCYVQNIKSSIKVRFLIVLGMQKKMKTIVNTAVARAGAVVRVGVH